MLRYYFQSMVSNLVIPLLKKVKGAKRKKKRTREDVGEDDADDDDDAVETAAAAGDADDDGAQWEKRILEWFNVTQTTSQGKRNDDGDKQGMGPVVGGSKDLFQEHKEPQKVVSPKDLHMAMTK